MIHRRTLRRVTGWRFDDGQIEKSIYGASNFSPFRYLDRLKNAQRAAYFSAGSRRRGTPAKKQFEKMRLYTKLDSKSVSKLLTRSAVICPKGLLSRLLKYVEHHSLTSVYVQNKGSFRHFRLPCCTTAAVVPAHLFDI